MQIEATKVRASKFVDSILRLSNVEAIGKYLLGSGRAQSSSVSIGFNSNVIGSAVTDVQVILLSQFDHKEQQLSVPWLHSSCPLGWE